MISKEEINIRKSLSDYIEKTDSRILEFGPLNYPLLDRNNYSEYFFADIRSTEEIRKLYRKNKYLSRTGISIDLDSIIPIDFVIKGSYKETFKNVEKFDYVIAAHVLEHIPDLLNFFLDVQNILKDDGQIIIIYPDKRFCFDHFRSDSKFSDVYDVWSDKNHDMASQVLDFYTNVITENNPSKFWDRSSQIEMYTAENFSKNFHIYQSVQKGKEEDDVHYWPFSDYTFLKFLRDCKMYNLYPFSLKKFIPTQVNTQEFLVILSKNNSKSFKIFDKNIEIAKKYFEEKFYQIGESDNNPRKEELIYLHQENKKLSVSIDKINEEKGKLNSEIESSKQRLNILNEQLQEKGRIRYMVKAILQKLIIYLPQMVEQRFLKIAKKKNHKNK